MEEEEEEEEEGKGWGGCYKVEVGRRGTENDTKSLDRR